jgi:hypothetical protein
MVVPIFRIKDSGVNRTQALVVPGSSSPLRGLIPIPHKRNIPIFIGPFNWNIFQQIQR